MTTPRRLRRVVRWSLAGILSLLVIAAGSTWWAHRHLATLVVEAFNRTYPQLELSAKVVAFTSAGDLEMKAIRMRVRETGQEVMSIPVAQVRFSWSGIRQQTIQELIVEQPLLRVNDAFLAAFARDPHAAASTELGSALPWRIERLAVKSGNAVVDLQGWPMMSFGFDVRLSESPEAGSEIAVSALQVRGPQDETTSVGWKMVRIKASPQELRAGRIREIVIEAPQVHVTDRLLALLPKSTSNDQATPAWSLGRLSVIGGRASANLAGWPNAEVHFSLQADQLSTAGGGSFEMLLEGLRASFPGEEREALTWASARILGTVDGARRGTLQEVIVDSPQIRVTDQALGWRRPVPTSATPSASEPMAWKVGRLALKKGSAQVDLADAPLVDFDFGLHLQNASVENAMDVQSFEVLDFSMRTRQPGVEPFLSIPAVRAEFRLADLMQQKRLARVRVEHPRFRYHRAFRELIASGAKPAPIAKKPAAEEAGPPLTVGELRLSDGRVFLDDLGIGVPGIECRVETAFRELALANGGGAGGHELQTIELSQIALRSPLDPFFTVLDLDSIFVRFTLAGLWRREIEEVAIVRPTLAVGPDLFWYVDRMQQNQADPSATPAIADEGPPWQIRKFSAEGGQLVLALEGQAKLALPMPFESQAENLNFRRLSELRLKLNITMPEQDYDYPGYELALRGVTGRIEFSLPPMRGKNNVVNTLRARDVRWKDFQGQEVFLDVTYDEKGIYGNLTGRGYTGVLRGQFNFLLTPESDWNGWVSGTHIALGPITKALAPEKFSLTGPADFRLTVTARASEIQSVVGDFKAVRKGKMKIGKLDDIIRELPGDWSGVKRGLSRISLETIRDFAYDTAHGEFKFQGLAGAVHLDLRGPLGSRKIEMNFHDEVASGTNRKVATNQP